MSYDDLKQQAGREPLDWIEIVLERCSLTYGTAPCQAALGVTGEAKCFNSWQTCQDPENYSAEDLSLKFCQPVERLPLQQRMIPFLDRVDPASGETDPAESLGKRGSIRVRLRDAPHDDRGIDPYVDERDYDPLERGNLWPRLRARWPFYVGRTLHWYSGYLPYWRSFTHTLTTDADWSTGTLDGVEADGGLKLVPSAQRVTSDGDVRVTTDGDTRYTEQIDG